jgi:hypothetical protein
MMKKLHEFFQWSSRTLLTLAVLLGVVLLLVFGCGRRPALPPPRPEPLISDGEHQYRLIRPERQIGPNLKEIALCERLGVSTNEWVYRLWKTNPPRFAGMPAGF